jgi:O-phosphoseryl-tRNA(Cys) synthetase
LWIGAVNFNEAIDLLEAVSDFQFEPSEEKPEFSVMDNQNQGYTLHVKAQLVNEKYRKYLVEIVESRKLRIRESEGYLIIYGP